MNNFRLSLLTTNRFPSTPTRAASTSNWSACSLRYVSPSAPSKRDVLHCAALGAVRPPPLRSPNGVARRHGQPAAAGHKPVLSEGAIRRAFERIEAYAGVEWLQEQLDYTPVRCWAIPPPSTRCMSKAPSSSYNPANQADPATPTTAS